MTASSISPGHEIVVSGSISNLGPGFDALSVAVDVFLRVRIEAVEAGPGPLVIEGQVPASGENRIATGFDRARARFGDVPRGARVHVTTDIPMKAGLGSSSAATVAGLKLYELLTAPRDPDLIMQIASEVEGHPDNAAAALLGGITLSCQCDDGRVITSSWAWPSDLPFVVGTPEAELETAFARKVLAAELPRADAIFNLQRALLLLRTLESREYAHLREALRDRWHQPARAGYVPGLAQALTIDHPSVLGVCLSGAGPSIAVIAAPGRQEEASAQLRRVYESLGIPCTIRHLAARPPVVAQQPVVASL
jgi:homoserine kinase